MAWILTEDPSALVPLSETVIADEDIFCADSKLLNEI
jgi:hypothetical protein